MIITDKFLSELSQLNRDVSILVRDKENGVLAKKIKQVLSKVEMLIKYPELDRFNVAFTFNELMNSYVSLKKNWDAESKENNDLNEIEKMLLVLSYDCYENCYRQLSSMVADVKQKLKQCGPYDDRKRKSAYVTFEKDCGKTFEVLIKLIDTFKIKDTWDKILPFLEEEIYVDIMTPHLIQIGYPKVSVFLREKLSDSWEFKPREKEGAFLSYSWCSDYTGRGNVTKWIQYSLELVNSTVKYRCEELSKLEAEMKKVAWASYQNFLKKYSLFIDYDTFQSLFYYLSRQENYLTDLAQHDLYDEKNCSSIFNIEQDSFNRFKKEYSALKVISIVYEYKKAEKIFKDLANNHKLPWIKKAAKKMLQTNR